MRALSLSSTGCPRARDRASVASQTPLTLAGPPAQPATPRPRPRYPLLADRRRTAPGRTDKWLLSTDRIDEAADRRCSSPGALLVAYGLWRWSWSRPVPPGREAPCLAGVLTWHTTPSRPGRRRWACEQAGAARRARPSLRRGRALAGHPDSGRRARHLRPRPRSPQQGWRCRGTKRGSRCATQRPGAILAVVAAATSARVAHRGPGDRPGPRCRRGIHPAIPW